MPGTPRRVSDIHCLSAAVISKADRFGGGASLIAEQLTLALAEAGHTAHHWVAYWGDGPRPHMRSLYGTRYRKHFVTLHKLVGALGLQELVPWEFAVLRRHFAAYDVAHFHDISSAISPLTLDLVSRMMPVVWTFHDCSPFTGGCLYPLDCRKFQTACGRCPQLGQWPLNGWLHRRLGLRLDFTGLLRAVKQQIARRGRFVAVTPSQWMADEALKSGMFASRPRVIPNWVDLELFRPMPKAEIREQLGLPREAFLAFVSAGYLSDARKGVAYAIQAIRGCGRNVAVVLVGNGDAEIRKSLGDTAVYPTGYIGDRRLLARHLAAADVSLSPTLADNLPCSIMEAMACGTPTIGFRTGGVPDLIDHEESGWLADCRDMDGLIRGLNLCYDHPETRRRWAQRGRENAVARYHRDIFVEAHLQLYRDLLRIPSQAENQVSARAA